MKNKVFILCTAAVALSVFSAYTTEAASDSRYSQKSQNYYQQRQHENAAQVDLYEENQKREPCQNYLDLPMHYPDDCASEKPNKAGLLPIVNSYTILFDLNKSNLRPNEYDKLNRVVNEINKYHPRQITVTGYTDSSGAKSYNQGLSKRREETVSSALIQRGIMNYTLDRKARGEHRQAVATADGVRNQENRRVVIDFRR